MAALAQRLPNVPLEIDTITDAPVQSEDGTLVVKTDGNEILRVLGLARDLVDEIAVPRGFQIVPRVWPRTIWCRHSTRVRPSPPRPGTAGAVGAKLVTARDARGNVCLCMVGSHDGEHDWETVK